MKTTQQITHYSENETVIEITATGIKGLMQTAEAFTGQGFFNVDGKSVVYTICNVTEEEADDAFTDDVNQLRIGNVAWN